MMEKYLITLLVIPMASIAAAQAGKTLKAILLPKEWHKYRLKPIDCPFCIAFWTTILAHTLILPDITHGFIIFVTALASGTIAGIIENR